jgi:hypothetical protein
VRGPVYYIKPLVYRGRAGFRVGQRGGDGWPISIWTGTRESAEVIRSAYRATAKGLMAPADRDAIVDRAMCNGPRA